MAARARPVLDRLGFSIHPETRVRSLRMGDRQLVEIARVLLESPRVLILDEPNSALSAAETERLFRILRDLREDGITTMLVSHRLQEVFAISDRVTVLRNGRHRFTADRADLTMDEVVEAMIGQAQESAFPARRIGHLSATGPSLNVEDLRSGTQLQGVTFEARRGEIVGLAGLEGSGTRPSSRCCSGSARRTMGGYRCRMAGRNRAPRPRPRAVACAWCPPIAVDRV